MTAIHFLFVFILAVAAVTAAYESSEEDLDKRSPLGTMRFGKRSGDNRELYNLYKKAIVDEETERSIRSPLGTMRFGKRSEGAPLGTMRFGKRNPLGTMRFGK